MKWTKIIPPLSLILAGIVTMSMKVVSEINAQELDRVVFNPENYENGSFHRGDITYTILHYSPLTYIIGALLIIAGAFMLYNEIKEAKHANNQ